MKLEFNILKQTLKKLIIWTIIYLIFIMIFYIIKSLSSQVVFQNLFLSLIGFPKHNKGSFLLLNIFSIFLNIFFVYDYFMYDINNFYSNIILRISSKVRIKNKVIVLVLFTVIYRTLLFIFKFLLFKDVIFDIKYYIFYITMYLFLVVMEVFILSFKMKDTIKLLITFIFSFTVMLFYNFYVITILMLIFLFIIFKYYKINLN